MIVCHGINPEFRHIQSELIYTHSTQGKHFRLYPFSKLDNSLLPEYKKIERDYNAILFSNFAHKPAKQSKAPKP